MHFKHGNGIRHLMKAYGLDLCGKVLRIGKSIGQYSSSPGISYQEVDYQVISQIKGFGRLGQRVRIFHALVEQTPTAEIRKIELNKKLFHKGNKLIICAELVKDDEGMFRFESIDPFCGAVRVPKNMTKRK